MSTLGYQEPAVWGPHAWVFLFTIGLTRDYASYKTFFENLHAVLPCDRCRTNYMKYMTAHPLKRSTDIMQWLVDLHNQDAKQKRTKAEVVEYYRKLYKMPSNVARVDTDPLPRQSCCGHRKPTTMRAWVRPRP